MKPCGYCGQENEDSALCCVICRTEFRPGEPLDPKLIDPSAALVAVAKFGDQIHAKLLRDELESAGISACIPEDMSANPFGQFIPLTQFTVQVAASDYKAAMEIVAAQMPRSSPEARDE